MVFALCLLVLFIILYIVYRIKLDNGEIVYVIGVDSGGDEYVDPEEIENSSYYDSRVTVSSSDVNTQYLIVNGNGMNECNLFSGDVIAAEKVDQLDESMVKQIIHKDDIIWIQTENNLDIIRVFNEWTPDGFNAYSNVYGRKCLFDYKTGNIIRGIVRYKVS